MENKMMNSYNCRQNASHCCTQDCSSSLNHMNACSNSIKTQNTGYGNLYGKIDYLPLGMAYVPTQYYDHIFDLNRGLKEGTIFPELCLPFCGKRRKCSC